MVNFSENMDSGGSDDVEGICAIYKAHISEVNNLLQKLKENEFSNIRGTQKLHRKILKDINFLSEAFQNNNIKKEHLVCTNLHFYKALIEEIMNNPETEAVLETFPYKSSNNYQTRLTVDMVSCNCSKEQQTWTKVIARNPSALHQIFKDGDGFGRRSIIDQAASYVQASSQNLHMYCSPHVVFSFINGVPEEMKLFLEKMGIRVKGKVISLEAKLDSDYEDDSDGSCNTIFPVRQKFPKRLNLCVTTMIAYVSSLTNGGCNKTFAEPLLNQQAEWERSNPVKPLLDKIFEGKELICCITAFEDFKNIIEMVGGDREKDRAAHLLSRVKVVADSSFNALNPSGKIKRRSLLIFGTGHEHKAVTITANKGFVHASKQKGVKFAVFIHESRALTERTSLKCEDQYSKAVEVGTVCTK